MFCRANYGWAVTEIKRETLVRSWFWHLTIVNETGLLISSAVELVESGVGTADLKVGILEELDAIRCQWCSCVAFTLLEFLILLSFAHETSFSDGEMSASDVVSCEWTQICICCFWRPIQVFVGLQGGSEGNGCLAPDNYAVAFNLFLIFESVRRVARFLLLKDILETVYVVWSLSGRVYTQFKVACQARPLYWVSFFCRIGICSNPVSRSVLERLFMLA